MSLNVTGTKPKSFYFLLAFVLLLTAGALVWLWYPKYVELTPEAGVDQASLLQRLEEQGIDYKVDALGNLLIEESGLGKVKIAQASNRQAGFDTHGLELYDQADYSMTEHTQQITMLRALQGELERTLGALDFVRYARVHLTFGEKKMFEKQPVPAKAAVTLFPEYELNRAQIDGVQALVAAAVPGLKAEAVTILTEDGRVLSRTAETNATLGAAHIQQQIELEYRQKVESLLGLVYTPADYSVAVNVELNTAEKRIVRQELLTDAAGNGVVVQKQQSTSKNRAVDGGNQPIDSSETTDVRYAHGTATEELTEPAGAVARVALSVLIRADASADKRQQLQQAIEVAAGYNQKRGDQVSVQFVGAAARVPATTVASQTVQAAPINMASNESTNWVVIVAVAAVVLLGMIAAMFWRRRKPSLTAAERQAVLDEVQQWLAQSEAKRG